MIPKVIHYCWFGNGEKPELVRRCMRSWSQYCPDYEIIEWNESNWDVNQYTYAKQAYEQKKFAFVSDVARLDIIYNHGGIYLDTDVELKQSIDQLLTHEVVFAFESQVAINSGLGFCAIANSEIVKSALMAYKNRNFLLPGGGCDYTTTPNIITKAIRNYLPALMMTGQTQIFDNTLFLGCLDYHPFAAHHCSGLWGSQEEWQLRADSLPIRRPPPAFLRRLLRRPKLERFLYFHSPRVFHRVYIFIAYDWIDFGFIYPFVRLSKKLSAKKIK